MPLAAGQPAEAASVPMILASSALFLDFDGTLVELAPTPDAVQVDPGLPTVLAALSARLGGALAIVSGRRIDDLDRFLAPFKPVLAAEHGAILRLADRRLVRARAVDLRSVVEVAAALARAHPGLALEAKSATVALHYRAAPQLEQLCLDTMTAAIERRPELELLRGKCVVEARPLGIDKGRAITALMAQPPFAGRRPIFAGDDTTDEPGFDVVQAAGGLAIKVGRGATRASRVCDSPQALRAWLAAALEA